MFPDTSKGAINLIAWVSVLGIGCFQAFVLDADAQTQWVEVQRPGQLFSIRVQFSSIQNVALKYDNGEVLQNFGAPRIARPESLEFIQYREVSA